MNDKHAAEGITSDGDVPLEQAAVVHSLKRGIKSSPAIATVPEKRIINPSSIQFMEKYFPEASVEDWKNWKWQIRNSFANSQQLAKVIDLTDSELQIFLSRGMNLPFRITPYYASLLLDEETGPLIRKSQVPTMSEMIMSQGEESDPLGEEHDSPVPHLVHRYPDRVLFLATNFCSTYCRYCTRSHMVGQEAKHYDLRNWELAFDYIRNHTQIRDVLISGGDPLTISDGHIQYLLAKLRAIPHLEMIRIGTKVPVVLPQRITPALCKILKQFHPFFLSIHFMHPVELNAETSEALNRLADAGIPLGSQTVLLKGINDDVEVMKRLMQKLLMNRVRPYYIYQCDPIPGSAHFRTSVKKGLEIIEGLRGHTTGYAVPHFVIDAPGGGGKIPLLPEYVVGREGNDLILRNYEGKFFKYPDME